MCRPAAGWRCGLAWRADVHSHGPFSPEPERQLSALLWQQTPIPVVQLREAVRLIPNRVRVSPPNAKLDSSDAHLRLIVLEPRRHDGAPTRLRNTWDEMRPELPSHVAPQRLREHGSDLVFSDVGLLAVNSCELPRNVRTDTTLRHIPMLTLTGYGADHRQESLAPHRVRRPAGQGGRHRSAERGAHVARRQMTDAVSSSSTSHTRKEVAIRQGTGGAPSHAPRARLQGSAEGEVPHPRSVRPLSGGTNVEVPASHLGVILNSVSRYPRPRPSCRGRHLQRCPRGPGRHSRMV